MRRLALLIVIPALLVLPASASALTVSKAELKNGQLQVEGTGAAAGGVTATSSTSTAFARVFDAKGTFRLQATGFRADDCTVIVSDGRTPSAQPTLKGCTPVPPPPVTNPPPSGSCVITPQGPATFNVGDLQSYFFTTTGCDTSNGPVQWTLIGGQVPPGMGAPIFQGQTSGMVSGRPTTEGTFTFTVQVTDSAGATDAETFTSIVVASRPVSITNPASLPPATRGQAYQVNLATDVGLPGYSWALTGGSPPPGIRLTGNTGNAVAGTPTTAGTYTFTVTVTDSRGATSNRTFSLVVS